MRARDIEKRRELGGRNLLSVRTHNPVHFVPRPHQGSRDLKRGVAFLRAPRYADPSITRAAVNNCPTHCFHSSHPRRLASRLANKRALKKCAERMRAIMIHSPRTELCKTAGTSSGH